MATSSRHSGWRKDAANNRLDIFYNGTRHGHVDANGMRNITAIGYGTGTGSTVTQATNRATGVTINALCGSITTHTASLAAEASAVFTVTNSTVAIGDVVVVAIRSGMVALNTRATVTAVAAGSFDITIVNGNVAAGTAETGAIVINFAVIKAVTA